MSGDERITIRLRDGTDHVGQITRRTADRVVLDTGQRIALADVRAITAAAPESAKRDPRDRRLAACAHTFGYRGHCLTKSRRWSTTFKELRDARQRHVRKQLLASSADRAQRELAELVPDRRLATFAFAGIGHLTTADAYLAAKAAARAREERELARDALMTIRNRCPAHRREPPQDPPPAGTA